MRCPVPTALDEGSFNWTMKIDRNWTFVLCLFRAIVTEFRHISRAFTMYIPPHFAETRPEELQRIIRAHALGILVTRDDAGLDANHIPFEFDPDRGTHGLLTAHVARANDIWQRCPTGTPVMVIFRGAEGYISPNWYPSKHEAHRQVPTYNYLVVHAHGRIAVHDDERFLRGLVARLTRKMEAAEPVPWKIGDAPKEYIDQMLGAIVGLEIEVTRLVGKAKLSQNKTDADRRGAAEGLRRHGRDETDALADAMLKAPPLPE
jgi:transcriptional regulator